MTWFYNWKIAKKLLTGFVLVAAIAGIVGAFGIYNLYTLTNEDKQLYELSTVPLGDVMDMLESYYITRVQVRNMMLSKDPAERENLAAQSRQEVQKFKKSIEKYATTVHTDAGRQNLAALQAGIAAYEPLMEKAIGQVQSGQMAAAAQLSQTEGIRVGKMVEDALRAAKDLKIKEAEAKAASNQVAAHQAMIVVNGIVVLAVLVAILLGFFLSRIISNPINRLVAAAERLAVGDVNVNIEASTSDEVGILMRSFGKMVDSIREQALAVEKIAAGDLTVQVKVRSENDLLGKKLSEMIETNNQILGSVSYAAEQVAAGSQQIAASGQALSQGSTEQASSIEEITASMTQVAAQTKQNAVNANQANELAAMAREQATEGNIQMQGMVKAMAEINESSTNISRIIKVIDEIAFQTNILALNAAVEAARAGQHGKGFAVVAEEVRNLAARSANAAKETTAMIEGSIKKVDAGTKIANQTAEALNGIVDGVAKAAALVGEIAAASNEQATAISQVNQAITQVSQVVQTNSATAEESAAASEELSGQAEIMKENVRRFKLKKISRGVKNGGETALSPEVLQAIESMLEKRKQTEPAGDGRCQPALTAKAKIVLDDNEFGKY
ncbi:four helix bundle sensory module for signal transduction [Lucifera butyrica]|uniref:Four helix bundle sensory module for signal transduction n=1 Tax=Lucifera butyrica TaxID=1351585 RepID=A0A498R8R9_9FIRM|nr:methyl-accepting chemotaxis protein [Lucifera butyrica]VBB07599.1 four helix bundle sensory module for signal transduction [Lucifera butyrica]